MAKHARYSPSKLEALEHCPCFEYEESPDNERDDNNETPAERGTRLHKATETADLNLCLDDDERRQVQTCLDYTDSVIAAAGSDNNGRPIKILREAKVIVPDLTYGTLDFCAVGRTKAWILDYKFIRTPSISLPQFNLQVNTYAAGIFYRFKRVQEVSGNLLAPALGSVPDAAEIHRDDVPDIEGRIKSVIKNANDVFKKPTPCDLCSKCANAGRCPALGTTAVAMARSIGLPVPAQFSPEMSTSPRDRAIAQVLASALEQWAEQVKKGNNLWGANGGELPGHIRVKRAGRVSVSNGRRAIELLGTLVPHDALMEACSVSLKTITDYLMETGAMKREEARERIMDVLGEVAQRGPEIEFWQRQRNVAASDILIAHDEPAQLEASNA